MSAAQGQLDWLVNDFARDTPGVLHAWSRGGGIVTADVPAEALPPAEAASSRRPAEAAL